MSEANADSRPAAAVQPMVRPPQPVDPALDGARVQAVHQPREREILLSTHDPRHGELTWLLDFGPERARLMRSSGPTARRRNPPRPSVFCQWLRSRVVGGRLSGLWLRCGNVLDLPVETAKGTLHLVLELNRQDSNLLLLDADSCLLIAARHPRLPGRTLGPGKPYAPPQRLAEVPPEDTDAERLPPPDPEAAQAREQALRGAQKEADFAQQRREALRQAKRRVKALTHRLAQMEEDAAKAHGAEALREEGELLSIHRTRLEDGATSVTVPDEFHPDRPDRTLTLDPTLSPSDNIERRFAAYRKWRDAGPHIAQRQAETQAELDQWQTLQAQANAASTFADLPQLPDGKRGKGAPGQQSSKGGKSGKSGKSSAIAETLMTRLSSEGYTVLVGRSKTENDWLTFRMANGRDWWLHAQGIPGSHVVVRNPGGSALPRRTLLEAAWLAGYYSQRRKDGKVDVDYTERKHVHRIKGAEPGQVTYAHNGTLLVNLDDTTLRGVLNRLPEG